ncbi:MAG: class I SAM-dependent methyltransferase [Planctomycetota bacterium]|jgi:2-polyprenyl-3-methyl-5-hydroxy-6-metoxy-1,4-benzoquinol methylase
MERQPGTGMQDFINVNCPLCQSPKAETFHAAEKARYTRCLDCGMMYQSPRPADPIAVSVATTEDGVGYFDEKAFDKRKQKRYASVLADFSRYKQTGRLLEIGCASGGFLVAARNAGWNVHGVEISETAASIAREKHGLEVFVGDISEAKLGGVDFDVAVMNMVVEHLADPVATLKIVAGVLRLGGALWLSTPNYDSDTLELQPEPQYFPADHYSLFNPITIRTAIEKAGLSVRKLSTSGYRRSPKLKKTPMSRFIDKLGAPLVNLRKRGLRIKVLAEKRG